MNDRTEIKSLFFPQVPLYYSHEQGAYKSVIQSIKPNM